MIVKMIQDLGKRMEIKIEKMQEMFTKDLEELKNKQFKRSSPADPAARERVQSFSP